MLGGLDLYLSLKNHLFDHHHIYIPEHTFIDQLLVDLLHHLGHLLVLVDLNMSLIVKHHHLYDHCQISKM